MLILAAVLLLSVSIALWRVIHGPGRADRLLAVQLLGTGGAAILLVLAHETGQAALLDAALILALLAAVLSAALVQYLRRSQDND